MVDEGTVFRKIQQIPKTGSYLLTLPKDWCEGHSLVKGDRVELQIEDESILITLPQQKKRNQNSVTVNFHQDIKSDIVSLSRTLLKYYLGGYEQIIIEEIPLDGQIRYQLELSIDELTRKLDGCSTNKFDKIFELNINPQSRTPQDLLKELYTIAKEMVSRVLVLVKSYDATNAKILIQRENEADKIYFSIVRTLKNLLKYPNVRYDIDFELTNSLEYRMVASRFEHLADAAEAIAIAYQEDESASEIDSSEVISATYYQNLSAEARSGFNDLASEIEIGLEQAYYSFVESDETQAVTLSAKGREKLKHLEKIKTYNIHPLLLSLFEEAIESIMDILELVTE